MAEEIEYTTSSVQENDGGAVATVEGFCQKDQVVFQATLESAKDPSVPLGFITSPYGGGIIGKKRVNEGAISSTSFPAEKWRNRITVSSLSFAHYTAEAAETTWRVLVEVETSRGTLYIRIPIFNDNVQKLIANCQRRYEVEQRQGQRPDAPASHPM